MILYYMEENIMVKDLSRIAEHTKLYLDETIRKLNIISRSLWHLGMKRW